MATVVAAAKQTLTTGKEGEEDEKTRVLFTVHTFNTKMVECSDKISAQTINRTLRMFRDLRHRHVHVPQSSARMLVPSCIGSMNPSDVSSCPLPADLVTLVGRYADIMGRQNLQTVWPKETRGLNNYEADQIRSILATYFKCDALKLDAFLQKHKALMVATDLVVIALASESESERARATSVDIWIPEKINWDVIDLKAIFPHVLLDSIIQSGPTSSVGLDYNSVDFVRWVTIDVGDTRSRTPWNTIVYDGIHVTGTIEDFRNVDMRWASSDLGWTLNPIGFNVEQPSRKYLENAYCSNSSHGWHDSSHLARVHCHTCQSSWCSSCLVSGYAQWHASTISSSSSSAINKTYCRACLISSQLKGIDTSFTKLITGCQAQEWTFLSKHRHCFSIVIYPDALPVDNLVRVSTLNQSSSPPWISGWFGSTLDDTFDVKLYTKHVDMVRIRPTATITTLVLNFGASIIDRNYCVIDIHGIHIRPLPSC